MPIAEPTYASATRAGLTRPKNESQETPANVQNMEQPSYALPTYASTTRARPKNEETPVRPILASTIRSKLAEPKDESQKTPATVQNMPNAESPLAGNENSHYTKPHLVPRTHPEDDDYPSFGKMGSSELTGLSNFEPPDKEKETNLQHDQETLETILWELRQTQLGQQMTEEELEEHAKSLSVPYDPLTRENKALVDLQSGIRGPDQDTRDEESILIWITESGVTQMPQWQADPYITSNKSTRR